MRLTQEFTEYCNQVRALSAEEKSGFVRKIFQREYPNNRSGGHYMVLHFIIQYTLLYQEKSEGCKKAWRVLRGLDTYEEGSIEKAVMNCNDSLYQPAEEPRYRNPANLGRWQEEIC